MHRLLGFTTRTHKDPMHRNICDCLRFEGRKSIIWRLFPAFLILLPTALSIYLYANRDHVYSGSFVSFVQDDRVAVQVVIQIYVYALALMQITVFNMIFNFATRLRIALKGINLEQITLCHAVTSGEIEWTLPVGLMLVTLIMAVALIAPGLFWTGSLTPVLYLGLEAPGSMKLPAFTPDSRSLWDFEFEAVGEDIYNFVNNCQRLKDRRSFVTNCPVPTLQSPLLLTGAGATTANGNLRTYAKHASPAWTYEGRSFGVGTSVGLAEPSFAHPSPNSPNIYTYNETGYNVEVGCTKNANSKISITLQNASVPISTYYLTGYLPNEDTDSSESYPITSFRDDYDNLCAWAARSNNRGNYIGIASGRGNYSYLNTLECKINFQPTVFNINVNVSDQSISVKPMINYSTLHDIDKTSRLIFNTVESLNLLSRISNTLYLSSIGDSLQSNVMNMASRLNASSISDQIITSATAEYFEVIIDDILVAYSSSQLLIANDTRTTSILGLSEGAKIGGWIYQLLSLILNCLLILMVLIEAIRTRLWRNLPRFNHSDIRHCIVAASAGGAELATAVAAAKDSKAIMVGAKESNFVDGMVAVGIPSVNDVMMQDLTTRNTEGRRNGDETSLVVRADRERSASRVSRFSGGWVGVGGGIGTAK